METRSIDSVYSDEVFGKSIAAAYDDLKTPLVRLGYVLEISHVAVENQTHAYTRLVIGILQGDKFTEKEEVDSPAVDDIWWTRSKFLIVPGRQLIARLTGCTSGDVLYMAYEGIMYKMGGK